MSSAARERIRIIQHELARRGFDPGVIDGIWGRNTERAVRAYQSSKGLEVDGIVGPLTWAALTGAAVPAGMADSPAMPWFQEARRLIGVREKVGPGSEPRIINWGIKAAIDYKSDDIPWCGLFVAHCISATLMNEKLPGNPLGARQWLKFGAPCDPQLGAILVFHRNGAKGWEGHVGFYAGEEEGGEHLHVLGGNQNDAVSIVRIAQDRLLGARWPATVPLFASGRPTFAGGQWFFSENEA